MITRRLLLRAGGMASLGLLAACSGSRSAPRPGPERLAADNTVPTRRTSLQRGGQVIIALPQWLGNLNPMHQQGAVPANALLQTFTGVSNWDYGGDGSFTPRTEYCLDVTTVQVSGRTRVVLSLNPEAVWNSGEPISAADYRALLALATASVGDERLALPQGWDRIESIEAGKDQFEVVVTFSTIYPHWPATLATIVPAALSADMEAFSSWTDVALADHATGPFRVGSADAQHQALTLEANPRWWGDPALLTRVVLSAVEASAAGQDYAQERIDVLHNITDPGIYDDCRGRAGATVRQAMGLSWRRLVINGKAGLLTDLELRKALTKGLDRSAIAARALTGMPVQTEALMTGNHIFSPSDFRYQDNTGRMGLNPAEAMEALETQGWIVSGKGEIRSKDGQRLSVGLLSTPDNAAQGEARAVRECLRAIGIEIIIETVDEATFRVRTQAGSFETAVLPQTTGRHPLERVASLYGQGSTGAGTGLTSPEVEELVRLMEVEGHDDTRFELANEIDRKIWDLSADIPLYVIPEMTAVPDGLVNYGSFGMLSPHVEDIGYMRGSAAVSGRTDQK